MATFTTTAKPRYPERPGQEPAQLVQRTWGGGFRVTDTGLASETYRQMTVAFRGLTGTEWDSIYTFFSSTVEWAMTTFDWTDPFGTQYTGLRYVGGIPEARSRNQDRWDVDLVFARDAGV